MRKTGSGGRCCVTQGASLALSEDRGVAGVEESTRGRWYMSNYGWFALLHSRNQHTIISDFPPIKKLKQQQQQEKSLLWTYYAYISSMEREGGFRGEPTTVHFLWAQKASLRHLAAYKCNSACSRDMTLHSAIWGFRDIFWQSLQLLHFSAMAENHSDFSENGNKRAVVFSQTPFCVTYQWACI